MARPQHVLREMDRSPRRGLSDCQIVGDQSVISDNGLTGKAAAPLNGWMSFGYTRLLGGRHSAGESEIWYGQGSSSTVSYHDFSYENHGERAWTQAPAQIG